MKNKMANRVILPQHTMTIKHVI